MEIFLTLKELFANDDSVTEAKLAQHRSVFPEEAKPLKDTASVFGGKPRISTSASFTPLGHISLDSYYEEPEKVADDNLGEGVYWISAFYVSKALQKYGLGRATMDLVAEIATKDPLYAKTLALSTAINKAELHLARRAAMGKQPPEVSWHY